MTTQPDDGQRPVDAVDDSGDDPDQTAAFLRGFEEGYRRPVTPGIDYYAPADAQGTDWSALMDEHPGVPLVDLARAKPGSLGGFIPELVTEEYLPERPDRWTTPPS